MSFYTLKLDETIRFNSLHKIDYTGWKPRLKLLSDFDVILSESSHVHLRCNSEEHVLQPGEVFIAHPGQSVCILAETAPKAGVWVLHFSCATYESRSLHEILENPSDYNRTPLLGGEIYLAKKQKALDDRMYGILNGMEEELRYKTYGYENKANLLLLNLLYELHRSSAQRIFHRDAEYNFNTANSYVRKTVEYLHKNYARDVRIADMETLLCLNYDYANTIFKKMTGYTIMSYVDNIRLNRTRELLESTTLTLAEISALVGVNDPHYLSRKFKKAEGLSPSAFRKKFF